jgi:hypothetical protein
MMMSFDYPNNTKYDMMNNDVGDYGQHAFSRTTFLDNVDSRLSSLMDSASTAMFVATSSTKRQEKEQRRSALQTLVDNQILRQSDVLLESGKDLFLSNLVAGTGGYRQRIMENRTMFNEYASCHNDCEQNRIVREIIESVWYNEGRFLKIDATINSVVVVEDKTLLEIIIGDLTNPRNPFPAVYGPGGNNPFGQKKSHALKHNRRVQNGKNNSNHNSGDKKQTNFKKEAPKLAQALTAKRDDGAAKKKIMASGGNNNKRKADTDGQQQQQKSIDPKKRSGNGRRRPYHHNKRSKNVNKMEF